MFDSFTLTTSIAAGCGKPAALPTKDVCALHMGPKILFSNSMSVCTDKVDPNDDIYCYHAPTRGSSTLQFLKSDKLSANQGLRTVC